MEFKQSDPCDDLPTFNDTYAISKDSISNIDIFREYVELCNLEIVYDENNYILITGKDEDLKKFIEYW